jgi:hypothetical protein
MRIEKGKSYEFYLMPNYFDLQNGYEEIKYTFKKDPRHLATKYFMYVLNEGKIEVLVCGNTIVKFIKETLSGYYTNANGDFTSYNPVSEYLTNEEGELIVIDDYNEVDKEYYLEEGYTLHNDVVFVKPMNPFDINTGLKLKFQTVDAEGFMKIVDMKFIESTPIYKDGDDKEAIVKLYDDVPKLEDYVENHKKEMLSNNEWLFGNEARELVFNSKHQKV